MSEERNPQPDDSWLVAPIQVITRVVLRAPRIVLTCAAVLAAVAVFWATNEMGFRTSRLDLLSPDAEYNQLWLQYRERFLHEDDAVIVVQGENPDRVLQALDAVAETLSADDQNFHHVLHRIELEPIEAKGLYYLSVDDLTYLESSLDEIQPLLDGDWSQIRLDHQLRSAAIGSSTDAPNTRQHQAAAHLERLSKTLASSFEPENQGYASPWKIGEPLSGGAVSKWDQLSQNGGRMLTNDGRMGFILLRLARDEQQLDPTSRSLGRLREHLARAQSEQPDVKVGLTGLPVIECDEMHSSQKDMLQASAISLVGVACLFVAGLGGVRHPMLTVATLLLALAWSFGYITVAVGHLNILSVAFGVILIGLGIDFGVHYVSRYLPLRTESHGVLEAITGTSISVGPGLIVGAITTSIAFQNGSITYPFRQI